MFSGVIESGFIFETIIPPKPIYTYLYKCGAELYLDPLRSMLLNTELIGIISLDAKECGVGLLDGTSCQILKTITSGVAGKSSKGGSSARRYERNREAELNRFYHRAGELVNNCLLGYESRLKSIVVSGPGFTKDDFLKHEYIDYRLRQKLSSTIDIEYAGDDGILQTLNYLNT